MSEFRVASTAETFQRIKNALATSDPFVYTRLGDGHMEIMLGRRDSYHSQNFDLAQELRALWRWDPTDRLHKSGLAMHQDEPGMIPGLFKGWNNPDYTQFQSQRDFENAIALHYYAVFKPHLLRQLMDSLRDRPKVVLTSLTQDLEPFVGRHIRVLIPPTNAYLSIDRWFPSLLQEPLIILGAGMASEAAALRLLKTHRDVQSINMGSLLDYSVGLNTRTWMQLADELHPESRELILRG